MKAIEAKEIHHSYEFEGNKNLSLDGVSLSVEQGEFVAILGHNGCGKSTLVKHFNALIPLQQGVLTVAGLDARSRANIYKIRRECGMVFQNPECQLFETTVERDVMFGLKHLNLPKGENLERVKWALETVGFDFEKVRQLSPLGLSGGEKRRVAIAGVLVVKPEVLILDEPVAGLDPLGREAFLRLTDELNAAGTTIIMVSHNADALAEHAKRIVLLENGEIIIDGSAKEVLVNTDKLTKSQIGISQSTIIAKMLLERGIDIKPDTIRYDELISQLISLKRGEVKP